MKIFGRLHAERNSFQIDKHFYLLYIISICIDSTKVEENF